MVKQQYKENNTALKISSITFGVQSANEIAKQSQVECVNKMFYYTDNKRMPVPYGVLDTKMGTSQKNNKCSTCLKDQWQCMGHFGHISLELPLYNIGFLKLIVQMLQCICKSCSHILLSEEDRKVFSKKIRNPNNNVQSKRIIFREIIGKCKKVSTCPHCQSLNGQVKSSGLMRITHRRFKLAKKNEPKIMDDLQAYDNILEYKPDLKGAVNRDIETLLDPQTVAALFENVPVRDYEYLLLDPETTSPVDFIVTKLAVPPPSIRPSVASRFISGTNEDDLTVKLSEMILLNDVVVKHKSSTTKYTMIADDWESLQAQYAMYINSETPGIPANMQPQKPFKGIVQRLKGKHGRFRGNLSGKRVDFSGRTVISPNPYLRINEVGVPLLMAKTLTYPERVNKYNIQRLQQLVKNGPFTYPGANNIQYKNGMRKYLGYGNREMEANKLTFGDIVERQLADGDILLFNRQPSLHKLSLMAHRARVLPFRTLRFNECVCTPYNADFDGDEMNIHLPQTEEARAEAIILMESKSNLVTPRNGEMVIGAIQDFITGAYYLTHKDTVFTRQQAMELVGLLLSTYEKENIELPPPHIIKPFPLWSGKQLFGLIIRPNRKSPIKINLVTRTKMHDKKIKDLCPDDTIVVVRNSELLSGYLDKSLLGSGTKKGIFYVLLRDYGEDFAAEAMWRLSTCMASYLSRAGFSIGIGDVTPGAKLLEEKHKLLNKGYKECQNYIQQLKNKELKAQPGFTEEETLESLLLKSLSDLRNHAGDVCFKELPGSNSPRIMSVCGSKGSLLNISQMIACVGQQAISGKRAPDGFINRTLPHFPQFTKTPEAKGFVENSFYSGLVPTEFIFHTMGGREGLVDTAVKTADTGYMQRRLVKALEDICCHYDGSVRTCSGGQIVQWVFGDDGLNPEFMEGDSSLVDYQRLLLTVQALYPCRDEEPLSAKMTEEYVNSILTSDDFRSCSNPKIEHDIMEFFGDYTKNIAKIEGVKQKYLQKRPRSKVSAEKVFSEVYRLTKTQLDHFFSNFYQKYHKARLPEGTAIGAICAQSIGEPATQMTLKTFHFAGVASMNITQGVPRIQEIINANRSISTPIITAYLENDEAEFATLVKGRVEKTLLGDICKYFEFCLMPGNHFILLKLDLNLIKKLKLEVKAETIQHAIFTKLRGFSFNDVRIVNSSTLAVYPAEKQKDKVGQLSALLNLKPQLSNVVIKGIPSINRAVIHKEKKEGAAGNEKKDTYKLLFEGEGLDNVIATIGVDGARTTSNNILEVARVLGIEAARAIIIKEIELTMTSHGISVDRRHLILLADLMTSMGEVLGITRFGLTKMKQSTLMLASFERTADHLFDAAYFGQEGPATGVTESIIIGNPIKIGTGFFKLQHNIDRPVLRPHRAPLVVELELHKKIFS